MRALLLLLPALIMAQNTAPKSPATTPKSVAAKPRSTTPTPAASRRVKPKPAAPKPTLMTDDDKTIYALGLSIYRSLSQFDLSPAEVELVKQALTDAAVNKPAEDLSTWGPKIQGFSQARSARVAEREKTLSKEYLAKAAAQAGAVKTESGLVYQELRAGTGASPKATDTVKVNYRGTLVNGTEFDSSYSRNEPAVFALNSVIPCWTEGLQKMKVGGKATLVCPSEIAYGEQGRPSIPGGAALIFEIELLDITTAAPAQ
jgi:FKBP-type peptidyl-prolyl cis-trans isomerase FkpA